MKYITLIIGLLVIGCGKQEQATTEEPVKELTLEEKKVVGAYEIKEGEPTGGGHAIHTGREVLLENGVAESYINGKKLEYIYKWSISEDGEIHIEDKDGIISVWGINKDKSITWIADIDKDGEREDFPKEEQVTFKKIK